MILSLLLAVALVQQTGAPAATNASPLPAAAPAPSSKETVLKGFDRPTGRRFTAEFDDTEIDDALRQIAKAAKLSIVFPGGHRHERVTAQFQDAAVEDALRAVLQQGGLVAEMHGTVITIHEADREVRRAQRDASRSGEKEHGYARHRDRVVHGDVVVRAGENQRDVVAIRGSVKVEGGSEVRDAVAILGGVSLESGAHVRDAVAVGGDLSVGPGAEVDGDAVSVGGDVHADPGAVIHGETTSVGIPALSRLPGLLGSKSFLARPSSPFWAIGQVLAKLVVFFVLGLLLFTLFPHRIDSVAAGFAAHPWKSIMTGLLGLVLAPILIVLLAVTIIGIPLVPVAALLVVAAGVLGFTALAMYLGRRLPPSVSRNAQVVQLALGSAIVVAITSIPLLGCMAWIAAALLVFGAVIRTRFGSQTPVLATTIPPSSPPPP